MIKMITKINEVNSEVINPDNFQYILRNKGVYVELKIKNDTIYFEIEDGLWEDD